MDLNTIKWLAWPLVIAIALLERWIRADPRPGLGYGFHAPASFRKRLGSNVALAAINGVQSALLISFLVLLVVDWGPNWRPASWPLWSQVLVDILILDLVIYSWHRMAHEIPLFWRFHQVHHFDQELDASSALRFHFLEVLLSALYRVPFLILLDVPLISVAIFETLVLIASVFHHSNIKLPQGLERRLSRLFITPSIHWIHHHAIRSDTDSNYGNVFSFWDPLFGTRSATQRHMGQKIGLEGDPPDKPLHRLLILPFGKQDP